MIATRRGRTPRYALAAAVVTGLCAVSALLGGQLDSTVLVIVFAAGLPSMAASALIFVLYWIAEREVNVERSLGRMRPYGQRLSIYDKDSGSYADWYFGLRLREEIARSDRYDQPFVLLLVEDLARGLGESMRKIVFRCLDDTLRSTDMVARVNDRRFVVLLTNTDLRGALVATTRIRESLQPGQISIGVACHPEDGPNAQSLLTAAGASTDLVSSVLRGSESVRVEMTLPDAPFAESPAPDNEQGRHLGTVEDQEDETPENVVQLHRPRTCILPGCVRRHHARGLCSTHYAQARRRAA